MTPDHITLVRTSFALVAPITDTAAALFYGHLFEANPSLRRLFKGDLARQGMKLMQTLGVAVAMLDKPAALLPALAKLGARHHHYGVQAGHYDTVGAALMATLQQGLGAAFDPPTRAAWTALYGLVASTMMAGADAEAARTAATPANDARAAAA